MRFGRAPRLSGGGQVMGVGLWLVAEFAKEDRSGFPSPTASGTAGPTCRRWCKALRALPWLCVFSLLFLTLSSGPSFALLGSSTAVVPSNNPSAFGQPVTLTATV